MNKTVLIIDEDINEYEILKERLERSGYTVFTATDCREGVELAARLNPGLIIYHFRLFLLTEKDFYRKKTANNKFIPIIMVNVSNKEEEILQAFAKGAADYITKPIHSREVEARVKAIMRRLEIAQTTKFEQIKLGNLILIPEQYELDLKTHRVTLSKKELQILLLLIERKKISREEIIKHLWGADYAGDPRIVDVNISKLRRKIENDPKNPQYIKTIKGYGYRLGGPISKDKIV